MAFQVLPPVSERISVLCFVDHPPPRPYPYHGGHDRDVNNAINQGGDSWSFGSDKWKRQKKRNQTEGNFRNLTWKSHGKIPEKSWNIIKISWERQKNKNLTKNPIKVSWKIKRVNRICTVSVPLNVKWFVPNNAFRIKRRCAGFPMRPSAHWFGDDDEHICFQRQQKTHLYNIRSGPFSPSPSLLAGQSVDFAKYFCSV